jgi:hypothetical protein
MRIYLLRFGKGGGIYRCRLGQRRDKLLPCVGDSVTNLEDVHVVDDCEYAFNRAKHRVQSIHSNINVAQSRHQRHQNHTINVSQPRHQRQPTTSSASANHTTNVNPPRLTCA